MADSSFAEILDEAIPTPAPEAEPEATPEVAPEAAPEAAPESGTIVPETDTPAAEPEVEPAAEPESVVDDAAEAALSLTPEELAEIKANPATAKLYKSLMRASTSKFQEISANKRVLQAMRDNRAR
jgi:hypothetical protein